MAKKRVTKKKSTSTNNKAEQPGKSSFKALLRDERTHKITGFFLLLLGVLMVLAMGSYMLTWQQDFDKLQSVGNSFFFDMGIKVANLLGRVGAWSAFQLMHNGFGVGAFLLASMPMVWGINLLAGRPYFSWFRNFRFVLLGTVLLSVCAAFFLSGSDFAYGGAFGKYASEALQRLLGSIGTGLLLALAVLGWIIWKFNPAIRIPEKEKLVPRINIPLRKEEKETPVLPVPVAEDAPAVTHPPLTAVEASVPVAATSAAAAEGMTVNDMLRQASANQLKEDGGVVVIMPKPEPVPTDVLTNFGMHEEDQAPVTAPEVPAKNEPDTRGPEPVAEIEPIPVPKAKKPLSEDLTLEINPPSADDAEDEEIAESTTAAKPAAPVIEPYDPSLDLKGFKMPTVDLLDTHGSEKVVADASELDQNKNQIIETLRNYDITIQRISATVGPTVTLYEIVPAPGVRISRIKNLEDDIALSLAALGIRIIAPIPGRGTIGIEVPNVRKSIVSMKTLLSSDKYTNSNYSLPIAIGKKIDNEHFVVDLASMPHMLMAGATGQGKSVGINAVLVSLLYKKHPSQLKLVLVDPKKVELSLYRAIEKHYLAKLPGEDEAIITDTRKVVHTLNALCIEMDNRYDLLKEAGVRNIKEYNEKFIKRKLNPQKGHQYLPFIVLVIDEFADLIMTAGKEVEMPIARLAQLARAVGIHLIIATQRPSVNIITGTIKANFPSRIAFKVSSKIDSRTILDAGGAEQLIGKGDMLISHHGELIRLQCAFVDTPEVERICEFIGEQRGYPEAFLLPEYVDEKEMEGRDFDLSDRDKLFDEAARLVVQNQVGSTSLIQRRMKLGYNRAGRLMDQLEAAGIVGPSQGSKAREVMVHSETELEEILGQIP